MSNDDKCVNSSGDFDMNYGKNAASDILCQKYDRCVACKTTVLIFLFGRFLIFLMVYFSGLLNHKMNFNTRAQF